MISRIHDRLGTAGFVVAIVALVVALGGTAWAAAKLNSTQKKEVEKIAKKFAGKNGINGINGTNGAPGPQGPKGDTGATGAPGKPGENGKNGEAGACSTSKPECVAPAGAILTGDWSFVSTDAEFAFQLSYPLRLGSNPTGVSWVEVTHPTAACPGLREATEAGHLCIYMEDNAPTSGNFNPVTNFGQTQDVRSGFTAFLSRKGAGESFALGSWAIKAP